MNGDIWGDIQWIGGKWTVLIGPNLIMSSTGSRFCSMKTTLKERSYSKYNSRSLNSFLIVRFESSLQDRVKIFHMIHVHTLKSTW